MLLVNTHQLKELNKEYSGFGEQKETEYLRNLYQLSFAVFDVSTTNHTPICRVAWGRNADHVCRQMKFYEKKKLKYVIMWCTELIFRPLRRINAQKFCFKLARETLAFKETNYDEVKALYMRKCHCTIFHVLLLLEKIWDQYIDSIRVCLWCK